MTLYLPSHHSAKHWAREGTRGGKLGNMQDRTGEGDVGGHTI